MGVRIFAPVDHPQTLRQSDPSLRDTDPAPLPEPTGHQRELLSAYDAIVEAPTDPAIYDRPTSSGQAIHERPTAPGASAPRTSAKVGRASEAAPPKDAPDSRPVTSSPGASGAPPKTPASREELLASVLEALRSVTSKHQ